MTTLTERDVRAMLDELVPPLAGHLGTQDHAVVVGSHYVGEWGECVDNLIAVLHRDRVVVTTRQHEVLAALAAPCGLALPKLAHSAG